MVEAMRESNVTAVTLSSWFVWDATFQRYGFVDPEAMPWHAMAKQFSWPLSRLEDQKDHWLYGFGFSYVCSREAAVEHPYPNSNNEDYPFLSELRRSSRRGVKLLYDRAGICLHTLHDGSSSCNYVT